MTLQIPKIEELHNESDVEQKLLYPLLTAAFPHGFALGAGDIQTKGSIKRFKIGKGKDEKLYFPDYIIAIGGLPLAAIEAKAPHEDLAEAFREVRLYAAEINAAYPADLNPLVHVAVSNGQRVLVGRWDHATPDIDLSLEDLTPYSSKYAAAQDLLGKPALLSAAEALSKRIKPVAFWKPRRLLGGRSVQNEEIGHNSFGATIAADFGHIFNPSTPEERAFVARHGYIPSRRRERYIDPIDRVIRAARPPSELDAKEIDDTAAPNEIARVLKTPKVLERQVLLIVGGVGAGKSTFIDHLLEVALPREMLRSTTWVRMNMNLAPVSAGEIYDWMRQQVIAGCRGNYPEIDFDSLGTIKQVFSGEVQKFIKGIGELYKKNESLFNEKLATRLEELTRDLHATALATAHYCSVHRGKLLIIVFDNCDKRSRDEQLLMFQAAQWIQKEFRALVILPIREDTYDNHRHEPPLDTALKDLVFRIEPPLFQHILIRRVQLTLNEIGKRTDATTYEYDLPNGFRVRYAASDQAFYLSCIVRSIFEYDRYIRRMIVGLAGRNMRQALELFLEFCTSGHISEDQILRIRQNLGQYTLPLFLVMRVLLRMNRRYYDSDYSYLKNLFAAETRDARPNYFSRLMILKWLEKHFTQAGPSGLRGYFPVSALKQGLIPLGVEEKAIDRELEILLKAQCIISEDLKIDALNDEVLIKLGPAGHVHLDMLASVDYLAATAEDTWFTDEDVARRVAERIKQLDQQYEPETALGNARELTQYLSKFRSVQKAAPETFLQPNLYETYADLTPAIGIVEKREKSVIAQPWREAEKKYRAGGEFFGVIVNRVQYGVFVELEPGVVGLAHKSHLPRDFETNDAFLPGEMILIQVLNLDAIKGRIDMHYIESAGQDASPADFTAPN